MACVFCLPQEPIWQNELLWVINAQHHDYPYYVQVVLKDHVAEMTQIAPHKRQLVMDVVYAIEEVQRSLLTPIKVNLAALGNVVPHLHWHVIPRWENDKHFPNPIWGEVTNPKFKNPKPITIKKYYQAIAQSLDEI